MGSAQIKLKAQSRLLELHKRSQETTTTIINKIRRQYILIVVTLELNF
jgi:hypothetical protein